MSGTIDNLDVVHEYFRRVDAASPTLIDLFTDDAQVYFPKYGIGRGREALIELLTGLGAFMESSTHDSATFRFIQDGDHVVAEGTTSGRLRDGSTWATGETPAGRFCNVFAFRDSLISRLHIYLDPDYAGKDEANFHWGHENRSW